MSKIIINENKLKQIIAESIQKFLKENIGASSTPDKSYLEVIEDMYPGDSIHVKFPENFELEYKRIFMDESQKFICNELQAYYWDEDDHCCKDLYFYTPDKENWVCKHWDLTPESTQKVKNYLAQAKYPYKH